ncbi:hypothetical protein PTKIN_Ptkin05aG0207500 [Pterospermum kingtungense]
MMDRRRAGSPVYGRQWSGGLSSSSGSSSPAHPQSRLHGAARGLSTIKQTLNVAAKAGAQRLAQVMAFQAPDEDEEDDDLGFRFGDPPTLSSSFSDNGLKNYSTFPAISVARPHRSPSPAFCRNFVEHAPSVRSTSAGRLAMWMRSTTPPPTLMLPSRNSVRRPITIRPIDLPNRSRDKRFTADVGQLKAKDKGGRHETSVLRDGVTGIYLFLFWCLTHTRTSLKYSNLDMPQEENDNLLDKLCSVKERREEVEARARELEKQVASSGEGVSLEAKLLSRSAFRKEAALHQREAGLKAAKQKKDSRDEEIAALHSELEVKCANDSGAIVQFLIISYLQPRPPPYYYYYYCKIGTGSGDPDRSKLVRDLNDREGNIESMLSVETGLRELASLKVEDAVLHALVRNRRQCLLHRSVSGLQLRKHDLAQVEELEKEIQDSKVKIEFFRTKMQELKSQMYSMIMLRHPSLREPAALDSNDAITVCDNVLLGKLTAIKDRSLEQMGSIE